FAAGLVTAGTVSLFFLAMISTCTGVFALRALYFTILKEASVPMALTGTAVGFISLIGYTPDIFMGPLMGWLLDRNPGALGHQHLFMVLAAFSLLGLVATILFHKFSQGEAMKVD
ncbi:MAG: Na+/melibiose symporter-like transporter, partial [Flavobacteriaceae bacterium]